MRCSNGLSLTILCSLFISYATAKIAPYQEPLRPRFHYSPAKGWMNDPNGLIFHRNKYHLYYQHNANGPEFGDIEWGHASSYDLRRWEEHPVALERETDSKGNTIISPYTGSIVYDVFNSSGFQTEKSCPPLVAVFTEAAVMKFIDQQGEILDEGPQTQSLAYSFDDGLTWTQYEGNPVISTPPEPYTAETTNFRDPQVFWYPQTAKSQPDTSKPGHWVMTVALAKVHKILIYTSDNLKDWKVASEFGPFNAVGGNWECPNLFPLPLSPVSYLQSWQNWFTGTEPELKWVFVVGLGSGGPKTGSGTQYFIGDFDGKSFTPDPETIVHPRAVQQDAQFEGSSEQIQFGTNGTTQPPEPADGTSKRVFQRATYTANWVDLGPDFYAMAVWNGLPNYERSAIAWMSNWNYTSAIVTVPWRGAMTMPRQLSLKQIDNKLVLIQQPTGLRYDGKTLFEEEYASLDAGEIMIDANAVDFEMNLRFATTGNATQFGVYTRLIRSAHQATTIGYDFTTRQMLFDRSISQLGRFPDSFKTYYMAPLEPSADGMVNIRAICDRSSVEMFGGEGEVTLTAQIFPLDIANQIVLVAEGGSVHNLTVTIRKIKGIW